MLMLLNATNMFKHQLLYVIATICYFVVVIQCKIRYPSKFGYSSTTKPIETTPSLPSTTPHLQSKTWALLVAGSATYSNYRHQADVCHAYQILRKNGIHEKNIIVMMADDIANNTRNPTPGIIINEPNGTDVYHGVQKDYTGKTVTPVNFLNVLQGNKKDMEKIGSGRVIESGPEDIIFVNFVDHGAPGILGFPSDFLTVAELIETLEKIANENRFSKMVLYVEACESGSMFDAVLPDNLDIFVMSASDPRESSYACYYDEKRGTYLGDVFSVNWIHQAETEKLYNASLNHLFEKVRTNTTTSHVEEYGDLDIGNTLASKIIGYSLNKTNTEFHDPEKDSVPQYDVPLEILKRKIEKARKTKDFGKLIQLNKEKKRIQQQQIKYFKTMNNILRIISNYDSEKYAELANTKPRITRNNMLCHKSAVETLNKFCFEVNNNPLVLPYLNSLINACSASWTNTKLIVQAIEENC